jgi:hypothetical protein
MFGHLACHYAWDSEVRVEACLYHMRLSIRTAVVALRFASFISSRVRYCLFTDLITPFDIPSLATVHTASRGITHSLLSSCELAHCLDVRIFCLILVSS